MSPTFQEWRSRYASQTLMVLTATAQRDEAEEELNGQVRNLKDLAAEIEKNMELEDFKVLLSGGGGFDIINNFPFPGEKVWEVHFDGRKDQVDKEDRFLTSRYCEIHACEDKNHLDDGKVCIRVLGYSQVIGLLILDCINPEEEVLLPPEDALAFLSLKEAEATPGMKIRMAAYDLFAGDGSK